MMKHLIIHHFGPINDVDIELKRVNLIIGPQSSGKSTVLKVACYCDWIEQKVELTQRPEVYCNAQNFVKNLVEFHKLEGYMHPDTVISYENDAVSFTYSASDNQCTFEWRNDKRWKYKRAKIAYIPSERNLVAAIPNWYQISMRNDNILDFMKEWEFARRTFTDGEQILNLPVKYSYNPSNQADSITLPNGKRLELTMASSGLQSLTPLYIVLRYLTSIFFDDLHTNVEQKILRDNLCKIVEKECTDASFDEQQQIIDSIMMPHHTNLYIEEPEAHIFPSTQKDFVYMLTEMINAEQKHNCFIATHSPYIMTAFNNLILAGEAAVENADKVAERISSQQQLRYNDVAAFEMKDGNISSILIISETPLDVILNKKR